MDPYKPPFNPINRPWDLSRSIELEKIFMIELSRASQRLSDAQSCQNYAKMQYFGSGVAWSGSGLALFDPWISSMDIIHGYHPWISSMDIILGYYPWILSMDPGRYMSLYVGICRYIRYMSLYVAISRYVSLYVLA